MEKAILEDDEDDDPIINSLRFLDYRCIRFCFHPMKDRFVIGNGWKDPNWKDVRSIRAGLDGDEKTYRGLVFGKNVIDIEQKSVSQLLVDEVSSDIDFGNGPSDDVQGYPPVLYLPDCEPHPVVAGRLLLLCRLHLYYIRLQYCDYHY